MQDKSAAGYSLTQRPSEAELLVERAQAAAHSGVYVCTLRTSLGADKLTVKVSVLDKPAAPQGPLVASDIRADSCSLSWTAPKVR